MKILRFIVVTDIPATYTAGRRFEFRPRYRLHRDVCGLLH